MLRLLGLIYGKIANARNLLFDMGVLRTFDLGARTISVGNITAGGTGKTPLVAYAAEILAARDERVCILTRGYGRRNAKGRILVSDGSTVFVDASIGGDEPVEIARKLIGKAIVISDPDRVAAAEWATQNFGVTAFVLDDGFQHRRAKRGVDIVCIDASDPFGGGRMLPAGYLREPAANLRRADIVVITRSDPAGDSTGLRTEIKSLAPRAAIFESYNSLRQRELIVGRAAFAFCGIGNPNNFFAMLTKEGAQLVGTRSFRDHHRYSKKDIVAIENEAVNAGAKVLLTTAKDGVKLDSSSFTLPLVIVEISVELDDPQAFADLL